MGQLEILRGHEVLIYSSAQKNKKVITVTQVTNQLSLKQTKTNLNGAIRELAWSTIPRTRSSNGPSHLVPLTRYPIHCINITSKKPVLYTLC